MADLDILMFFIYPCSWTQSLYFLCPIYQPLGGFTSLGVYFSKTTPLLAAFLSKYPPISYKRSYTSALIQSLFMQHPITLLDITAKLIIQQHCNFHIISIWPKKKYIYIYIYCFYFHHICCGFKQFDISLETAGVGGWYYW